MFILAEIGGKTREMRYSAIALSLLLACASRALAKRPTAAGLWVGNFFQGWTNGQRMTPQYSHDLQTFLTAKKRGDVYVLKLLPGKPMNGYYEAGQFIRTPSPALRPVGANRQSNPEPGLTIFGR